MGFYLMGWVFLFLLTALYKSVSVTGCFPQNDPSASGRKRAEQHPKNVMIIGAGAAGRTLLREYTTSQYVTEAVRCFIDDNSDKWGRYLEGVPIVGGRDKIQAMAAKCVTFKKSSLPSQGLNL